VQSVAFLLDIEPGTKNITGVRFKHYQKTNEPAYTQHTVRGKRYVLAAHAVANAVLLLASGACKGNDLVGRHLMDHPELLTWGTSKKTALWPMRGPLATSGIEDLRGGSFRKHHAPYRFEMGNDGWLWPAQSPAQDVMTLVDDEQQYGKALRDQLEQRVCRQFRFGILVEQLPEYNNQVTIDPAFKDVLDNYRPVIHYDLSPYTRAGFASAYDMAMKIFDKADIQDASSYPETAVGAFTCPDGRTLTFNGAGHFAGTHCMGSDPGKSVVNKYQRTWEHANLYLVGCGNMVNMGTSNPTLTMSALSCWAADNILQDLNGAPHAAD
jgi:choline dehydrogenase-like flavoprotein